MTESELIGVIIPPEDTIPILPILDVAGVDEDWIKRVSNELEEVYGE